MVRGYSTDVGIHTLTQVVVDKAGNRASATLSYEVVAIDRSALGAALDGAAALDPDDWTTSTWAVLRSVIDGDTGAQAVYDGTTFTEAQVLAATEGVQQAVAALAERGDPTALATLLAAGRQVAADLSGYTDASASVFQAALADADAIHQARDDKTQAQLDAATTRSQGGARRPRGQAGGRRQVGAPAGPRPGACGVQRRTTASPPTRGRASRPPSRQRGWSSPTRTPHRRRWTPQPRRYSGRGRSGAGPRRAAPADPVPVKVTLNQDRLRLARGQSLRLEEGVHDAEGGATYAGTAVWASSNPKVATVSAERGREGAEARQGHHQCAPPWPPGRPARRSPRRSR